MKIKVSVKIVRTLKGKFTCNTLYLLQTNTNKPIFIGKTDDKITTFNSPNSPARSVNRDTVEDGFGDLICRFRGASSFLDRVNLKSSLEDLSRALPPLNDWFAANWALAIASCEGMMLQTPTPRLPGWEWRPVRYRTRVSVFEHLTRWQVIHAGVSRKTNQDHKCMRPTQSKSRSIKIEIFFERIGRNRSFCFFRFRKVRVGSQCPAAANVKEERTVANEERRPSFPGLERPKRYCGES